MLFQDNAKKSLLTICLVLLFTLSLSSIIYANSLDRIKKEDEISFAMSGGYPPFNYYNDENELVGFDVDVAKEIADRLGVEVKYTTTAWGGITEGLRSGRYDAILGSMAVTPKRLKVVNFSIPYYFSGAQLIVRKDSNITSPQDIAGKPVGVTTGTTYKEDAEKLGAQVRLYNDDNQTLMELMNHRIDGVISDRVVGLNFKREGYEVKLVGKPLRREDIAVAFRKGDNALLYKVNAILLQMHQDGTLSEISNKWFGTDITSK